MDTLLNGTDRSLQPNINSYVLTPYVRRPGKDRTGINGHFPICGVKRSLAMPYWRLAINFLLVLWLFLFSFRLWTMLFCPDSCLVEIFRPSAYTVEQVFEKPSLLIIFIAHLGVRLCRIGIL